MNVTANVTGLLANTTYYYRLTATNSAGTSNGQIMSFTTTGAGAAPTVVTREATNVGRNGATLNGAIIPNGLSTTYRFQYGTSPTLLTSSTPTQSAGSGTTLVNVSANVTGLLANTTYYYRLTATNSAGTSNGQIMSFTTIP